MESEPDNEEESNATRNASQNLSDSQSTHTPYAVNFLSIAENYIMFRASEALSVTSYSKNPDKIVPLIDWNALQRAQQAMAKQISKSTATGMADPRRSRHPSPSSSIGEQAMPMHEEVLPDSESRRLSKKKGSEDESDYLEKMKVVIRPALGNDMLGVLKSWEAFERSKGYPMNMTVSRMGFLCAFKRY